MWTKEQKKMFYKCVLEFHLAFISGLEDSISSKKVQNCVIYSAYTCQLLSCLSARIPDITVRDLLLFISSCQKICFFGYILFKWYLFASFIHLFQSYLQKSIIFNMFFKKWIDLKQMTKPIFSVTLADHLIGEKKVLVCRVVRLCWSLFLCFRYILYVFEILQMELEKQSKE